MARHTAALGDYWMAEAIRLREEHWGPLADADAVRHARRNGGDSRARVLERARRLGARERLDTLIVRWRNGALTALAALLVLAAIAGAGTALGALGDGSRPVNVVWALGALLGLNTLTFLLWLLAFALPGTAGATVLGSAWMWATRKIARGPDAALVPQALLNLLARTGSLRWLFGSISHLAWLLALTSALCAMLAVLATERYRFVWASTLLDPDRYVQLTHGLGWLPDKIGFTLPDAAVVRASDGMAILPQAAQLQWSIWLIGVVVVYGIAPRLIAWIFSLAMTWTARRRLNLDLDLPGYAVLADRLTPAVEGLGIDRPADAMHAPRVAPQHAGIAGGGAIALALELPADISWPPPLFTHRADGASRAGLADGGNLDTREQRNAVLDALTATPAARLLIACDARQTPDRGALAMIAELSSKAGATHAWLIAPAEGAGRVPQWRARLNAAGMPAEAIHDAAAAAFDWLEASA
jgi:hypothetical protein